MQSTINLRKQRGVTLLEAAIAITVFSIGVLGMSQMQSYVYSQIKEQQHRNFAIWKGQELIERIKANNQPESISEYQQWINEFDELCLLDPPTRCADWYENNAKQNAAICNNTQVARFDSWDVICNGNDSLTERLDGFEAFLICSETIGADCEDDEDLILTLIWSSKTANRDSRLTGNTVIVQTEEATDSTSRTVTIDASENYFRQVFRP